MRDLRDPRELGEALLDPCAPTAETLSALYDRFHHAFEACPDYVDPENALARYGDPVKKHQARIALGMEVELP